MDILTLKDSLCNAVFCNSGEFLLEEKDKHATLKKVTLCNIPNGSLIIRMGNNVKFSNFLKDQRTWGYNKHSDYLIITNDKIVFIEMKSKKEVNQELIEDCIQKFTSDKCVIYYADYIFQEMLLKKTFFNIREHHYVLLYQNLSIAKTLTSIGAELPNITPSTFRRIPISNEGIVSFFRTI